MLEYLIQLPYEALGQKMLGFLEVIDIIQLENAAASQESQQLLRAILPYCSPIVVSDSWNSVKFNHIVCNWFCNRRCRVQFMRIPIESLCEVNFEHSILHDITLCLNVKASLQDMAILNDPNIRDKITKLDIKSDQDPAVMEVLFSLLTNSSIRSLDIQYSNLSQWMEHIKKIGPHLRVIAIHDWVIVSLTIKTITEYCPYLEKLSLKLITGVSDSSNILQRIASNCSHIRNIVIWLDYSSSAEADADLTVFAEKCPQLEELSLNCKQLTDQSVLALAQHCYRLKKLKLLYCKLTAVSLIALSERALPLEELGISSIPTLSAEIAAQCAHALSRICNLKTYSSSRSSHIQFMTGLRRLYLDSSEDHLLVPHLLLLLQGQSCGGLENLTMRSESSITPQQLCKLVRVFPQLRLLDFHCNSDAVLVELARSCPHLQKVTLDNIGEVTEKGVLALAAHCRQLREIDISNIIVTEETVRQLAQQCRHLIKLFVDVLEGETMVGHYQQYFGNDIRALRETE